MKQRYLESEIEGIAFKHGKMAFIAGPRQCGKTTMAKRLLRRRKGGRYYNYDDIEFRKVWTKQPRTIIPGESEDQLLGQYPLGGPADESRPLVVLDEIHKARLWKRTLKGVFDLAGSRADILVTGSARLRVYQKGSDSLTGRYFGFRLHPVTRREMRRPANDDPETVLDQLFQRSISKRKSTTSDYKALWEFGGFPEPLFAQDAKAARLWRENRIETVVREDLRDLTRIPELSRIEMMASLLPDCVGSLFSRAALREDMEVSFDTITRWIKYLEQLFYLYEIKPYQRSIRRSLKKAGKIYLWDFAEVQSEQARFENLVANHLLKACHFWTDTGEGRFELCFLRNKEKKEIDFLVTRDGTPWLPVEAKFTDTTPSENWEIFLPAIKCRRALQIVHRSGIWKTHKRDNGTLIVASADEVLNYLP